MANSNGNSEHHNGKGKRFLGMEFEPLPSTRERGIEILLILFGLLVFSIIPLGPVLFLVLLYYYPAVAILYVCWIYYDNDIRNNGGRPLQFFREWSLFFTFRDYFPIKLVKTVDLDPSRNYIFCSHPHGLVCNGAFGSFATEALGFKKLFPGLSPHLLTVEFYYWLPFTREFFLSIGACPATKKSMDYFLNYPGGGQVGVLMPGGIPEQLEARPHTDLVKLMNRKGFIKLAIQNGTPLVPVYSFGENDVYVQIKNPEGSLVRKIQLALINTIGFYFPLANGRGILQYTFGPLPRRIPITVVVGAPVEVEKISRPTQESIDAVHDRFVNSLKELFYTHRETCGYPNAEIKVA